MQIIPPLDADLADKIALLHVIGVKLPVDTSTPEGRDELQTIIRQELPAFAQQLIDWETPEELRDSRSGVIAWRDPELSESVDAHSPSKRLESLLEAALADWGIWHDLPRDMTASEVESRLLELNSPVRDQARQLCGTWHGACGSALAKLARSGSDYVKLSERPPVGKALRYYITR